MIDQSWINDLDKNHQRAIINKHPGAIKYINNPDSSLIKIVIDKDVDVLPDGIELCNKSQRYLLSRYPDMFHLIKNPDPDIIDLALKLRPANIQYVNEPTDEQMITVLSSNPNLIDLFVGDRLAAISDHVKSYAKIIQ